MNNWTMYYYSNNKLSIKQQNRYHIVVEWSLSINFNCSMLIHPYIYIGICIMFDSIY